MLLWIFNDVIRLEFGKLFNWIQIIVQFRVQCRCFLVSFAKFLRTPYLQTLRKKCPNMEFFLVRIFLYSDWMQENAGQKNLRIWTFLMQWEHLQTTASGFFHSLFCFCHPVCHPVCQNFEHVSSRPSTSFIKRRLQDRCFPVNTAKIFKNTHFEEYLQIAASEVRKNKKWNLTKQVFTRKQLQTCKFTEQRLYGFSIFFEKPFTKIWNHKDESM